MRRDVIRVVAATVPLMVPLPSSGNLCASRNHGVRGNVVRALPKYTAATTFENLMGEGLPQDAASLPMRGEILQSITEADTLTELVETALHAPIGYGFAMPEPVIRSGDTWVTTLRFPFQIEIQPS